MQNFLEAGPRLQAFQSFCIFFQHGPRSYIGRLWWRRMSPLRQAVRRERSKQASHLVRSRKACRKLLYHTEETLARSAH